MNIIAADTYPAKSCTAAKSSSAAIGAFSGAVLEGKTLDKAALMSGDYAVYSIKQLKSENTDTWKTEPEAGKSKVYFLLLLLVSPKFGTFTSLIFFSTSNIYFYFSYFFLCLKSLLLLLVLLGLLTFTLLFLTYLVFNIYFFQMSKSSKNHLIKTHYMLVDTKCLL